MLTILRKNKESLVIKIILLMIILSFAIFFGSSSLRNSRGGNPNVAATVNDTAISMQKAEFLFKAKLDEMSKAGGADLPEEFVNMIKTSVVENLINQELINQTLTQYGLQTSAAELVDSIKTNPQFVKDGKFDQDFYTKRFLPYYQYQHGSSFEGDLQKDLAAQKIFDLFSGMIKLSDVELARLYQETNTKFKFEYVQIPLVSKDKTNKTDEAATEMIPDPEKTAKSILAQWKMGSDINKIATDLKLTKKQTPELSLPRLQAIFGGKASPENLKLLAALTEQRPFPNSQIKEGNFYYVVKLTSRTAPETKPDEESLQTLQEAYQDELSMGLESSFLKALRAKAKIKKTAAAQP
ncbi:MAG: hypothetical protein ACD_62C00511G0005 [uncultured bacterium]|nr:MAG: hypothetical protein ACD_62C00511G0005 [uncultured bacterium]